VLTNIALVPTAVLDSPVEVTHKAAAPTAVLLDPVLQNKALRPKAVLLFPVEFSLKDSIPTPTLLAPVVLLVTEQKPTAVLELPSVLASSAKNLLLYFDSLLC
jgi:hypothetical protein